MDLVKLYPPFVENGTDLSGGINLMDRILF